MENLSGAPVREPSTGTGRLAAVLSSGSLAARNPLVRKLRATVTVGAAETDEIVTGVQRLLRDTRRPQAGPGDRNVCPECRRGYRGPTCPWCSR